jgi:uncharacterized radical SAM superfamily Fe-S cluster-containing enzyme
MSEINYKLIRYEKNKDKDGNVVSIFIAVLVKEGEESLIQEHWLTPDEIQRVLENENKLIPIVEMVAAEGLKELRQEVANRPQPPEIADEAKLKNFTINPSNVEKRVKELKEKNYGKIE